MNAIITLIAELIIKAIINYVIDRIDGDNNRACPTAKPRSNNDIIDRVIE